MTDTTTHPSADASSETAATAAPAPTCWPTFHADDAPALIDFLVDVVGFRRTVVYTDGALVAHAQLDWPEGGGVMLGSRRDDAAIKPGLASVYVVTDRVDEVHARVKDAPGVTITRQPEDTGYGSHEFGMTDPEGNYWSFGTYRGEPPQPA
jgi:uncharacterized glyoxalase superfamily protein PhnB